MRKSPQTRTIVQSHRSGGVVRRIEERHPITGDLDGAPDAETAIRRLERVGGNAEVTRFDDGRAAVRFVLWPAVGAQSAVSLRDAGQGVVVDSFRLHLPPALVPEGDHQEAVEAVGRVVEQADPPTYVAVYIPLSEDVNSGVPHVVFDPEDTRPRLLRYLPVSGFVEFVTDVTRVVENEL